MLQSKQQTKVVNVESEFHIDNAIEQFQHEVKSIFAQMGEIQDRLSTEKLKKQIDAQTKEINLNLKLILDSLKKESKSFDINVKNLKKLQSNFKN